MDFGKVMEGVGEEMTASIKWRKEQVNDNTPSTDIGGWWKYVRDVRAAVSCGACSDAVAKHREASRECANLRGWKLQVLTREFGIG